ncbi:MAG: adenylate/guanylate cyclase domain-containing protein [Candidatus Binatia bacterium]
MVSRQVHTVLTRELLVTNQVFQRLMSVRAEHLLAEAELLGSDFALKQVLVTYDPATLKSVAQNYRNRMGVDLLWITDERGIVLADSRGKLASGTALTSVPPLAAALTAEKPVALISEVNEELIQFMVVPILGPKVIGFLLMGANIGNETARQLQAETGSAVSFLTTDRLFASSWPPTGQSLLTPTQPPVTSIFQQRPETPVLLTLQGERFLSLLVPVQAQLPVPLYALVQRSYDEAIAPLVILRWQIAGVGLAALLGALILGGGLATGITAPIQGLVQSMQRVLQGDFQQRLAVKREDEIGFLAHSFNAMVEGLEEREHLKDMFGRFVSREVASAVLNGRVPLAGELREVSILFQDIRGFTTISERTAPEVLVRMLNQFFTEMVAAVEAEGGVVRQFTGDGVMALFGAPEAYEDAPARAVRAALDMVKRLSALNTRLREQHLPELRIGVGIHSGEVVAGLIGPDERFEYSVVGDPVNVASRIEGLTKELQSPIVISEATAARLGPEIILGRTASMPVKGKEKPVNVVEVLGAAPQEQADSSAPVSPPIRA